MANPQVNIDKLNAWFESMDDEQIKDYINHRTNHLTAAKVSRDAGFNRKALSDRKNGNPALQSRFDEIHAELRAKGILANEHTREIVGTPERPARIEKEAKQLRQAQQRINKLEKQLADANAKLANRESDMSSLSELRDVMVELGFPSR
jgi:DNA repair ATPase RecN